MSPRWRRWAFLPLLAPVLVPALPGLVTGGRWIPGDGFETPLPGLAEMGRQLAAGQWPIWTDLIYGGAPLISCGGVGMVYPPNLLLFTVLPAGLAYTLALALHLVWMAAGAWLYGRGMGRSRPATVLFVLGLCAGGYVVAHAENVMRIAAIAHLPWALLAGERLALAVTRGARRWRRPAALLGAVLGLSLLTGYYPFSVYLIGWTVLYTGGRVFQRLRGGDAPRARMTRAVAAVATALLLAALLSMVQTIPTALAAHHSVRVQLPEPGFPVESSVQPAQLVTWIAPFALRHPDWDAQIVFFAGLACVGLLPLALRRRPGLPWPGWLHLCLFLGSVVLALGDSLPGFAWIASHVPPLSQLGRPYRLYMVGALALPYLAACGLDRLRGAGWSGLVVPAPALAGLALALVGMADDPVDVAPVAAGAGATLVLAAVAVCPISARAQRVMVAAALVLIALEMGLFGACLQGYLGRSPLAPHVLGEPWTAVRLNDQLAEDERFLTIVPPDGEDDALLRIQTPMRFGLATVNTPASSLIPWWFEDLYGSAAVGRRSAEALALARVRCAIWTEAVPWRQFSELETRDGVRLGALQAVGPRVFAVEAAEILPREVIRQRLSTPGADLWSTVMTEEPPPPLESPGSVDPASASCGEVSLIEDHSTRITLHYSGEEPCYLVLVDSWYPGWSARIDGQSHRVFRADGVFRGVAVPAGEHRVELLYRALDVKLGALLSGIGLLGLGLLVLRPRR